MEYTLTVVRARPRVQDEETQTLLLGTRCPRRNTGVNRPHQQGDPGSYQRLNRPNGYSFSEGCSDGGAGVQYL